MQTRKEPEFWGLHKNKNCAFPLNLENRSFENVSFLNSNF